MLPTVTLEVDDVPSAQNRRLRMHWAARRDEDKRWRYYLLAAASHWAERSLHRGPMFPKAAPPARVEIRMWRTKTQDHDNATASVKGLIDGLVRLGALRDDSPKWMPELDVRDVVGSPKKTVIEITYKED